MIPFLLEIEDLLKEAHGKTYHRGRDQMIQYLENEPFYLVDKYELVEEFLKKCNQCIMYKK